MSREEDGSVLAEKPRSQRAAWRRLLSDLVKPPEGPRFRFFTMVAAPLLAAGLLTLWVRLSDFDLGAQRWLYRLGEGSWALGDHPFWKGLYAGGTLPAALVVFSALAAYALSWKRAALRQWRKVFLFVVLSGAIGPGVITNGILKEYWGRPRPRDLVEFGGRYPFEPVLTIDSASDGLSFPCGHATMGFFFLAGYFLLRRHRRDLATVFVFASLLVGGLMGVARMAQGAHFFSDAIWAAVVCWFTPMGLYYAMRLDRSLVVESETAKRMPLAVKAALSVLGVGMFAGVMLATPYAEKAVYTPLGGFVAEGNFDLRLSFAEGEFSIVPGTALRIEADSTGHGVPTSKVGKNYLQLEDGAVPQVVYAERVSGWFKELRTRTRVEVPWERLRRLVLLTGNGEIEVDLGEGAVGGEPLTIQIEFGKGSVRLGLGGAQVRTPGLQDDPRLVLEGAGGAPDGDARVVRIGLGKAFEGTVTLEREEGR